MKLHYNPLSTYSQKALIAFHEKGVPFEPALVNLMSPEGRAAYEAIYPLGKIPLLDAGAGHLVPESSIIIEYLERHYPGPRPLLAADEAERLEARLWDRFYDLYVQVPMQKIVTDHFRPEGEHDPHGVADAKATLGVAYGMIERAMADKTWAIGETFGLADCAAAPALFFADIVAPFSATHPHASAYFERLVQRASFKRAIVDAQTYFHMFPYKEAIPARFRSAGGTAS